MNMAKLQKIRGMNYRDIIPMLKRVNSLPCPTIFMGYWKSLQMAVAIMGALPATPYYPATPYTPIWQRNYWERIIRNETEYTRITNYIKNNPILWEKDCFNAGNDKCESEELP
jgi:hypothetical protein